MDFRLTDEQAELRDTVARYCADRFPLAAAADREGRPVDRSTWRGMASLGTFGVLLGDDAGGSGVGLLEAALVFEQLGAHLAPGPVVWTALAASFLEGAATGRVLAGGVLATEVDAGTTLVEHAADLDVILVVGDDVVACYTADLAAPEPLDPLDPLTPVGAFTGLQGGDVVGDRASAELLQMHGTVLSAAMLTGIASTALEVAATYALQRQQFGIPIGSFQAIKHILADMYVRHSLAQSATYAAAASAHDPGAPESRRAAASAKLLASDAALANAAAAVQVLGGMGFTWDMAPHRLLKRAWVLEQTFGTADDHARHLGATVAGAR